MCGATLRAVLGSMDQTRHVHMMPPEGEKGGSEGKAGKGGLTLTRRLITALVTAIYHARMLCLCLCVCCLCVVW